MECEEEQRAPRISEPQSSRRQLLQPCLRSIKIKPSLRAIPCAYSLNDPMPTISCDSCNASKRVMRGCHSMVHLELHNDRCAAGLCHVEEDEGTRSFVAGQMSRKRG